MKVWLEKQSLKKKKEKKKNEAHKKSLEFLIRKME